MGEQMKIAISEQIKEYRRKKQITQKELSKLLGISPQAISKWERDQGYPDITMLPCIAKLLGCSISDFFEENND